MLKILTKLKTVFDEMTSSLDIRKDSRNVRILVETYESQGTSEKEE